MLDSDWSIVPSSGMLFVDNHRGKQITQAHLGYWSQQCYTLARNACLFFVVVLHLVS